ncbi:MAG TPA: TetR/AcrR family transcriptional regulator [Candidatus Nanopelagicales bacterium]
MSQTSNEPVSTYERILREAAALFAVHGYHGTSTRDIAGRVGIRQPSLFHHFGSKHAIADRLFEIDLERSVRVSTHLAEASGPASVRLFRYLRFELEVTVSSPYDLRGLYLTDLLAEPDFAQRQSQYQAVLDALRQVVVQGIQTGEFLDEEPELFVEILNAVITHAVVPAADPIADGPQRVAALLVRSLLQDPGRLPKVLDAAPVEDLELS